MFATVLLLKTTANKKGVTFMSWILFSVLAAFIFAVVNIIDKLILTKWLKTPIIPIIAQGIIGFVASLFIYFTYGFSELPYSLIFLAAISGIFNILTIFFYLKAVKTEEISRVAPLFFINSLFVLIIASIFLGENFTAAKYLGMSLLIAGTILISIKKSLKSSFGKSFWYIILAALASAICAVITKYLLNYSDFWTIFAYARIGTIIVLIPVFYSNFPEILSSIKRMSMKSLSMISANEILNLIGILFVTVASVSGPVALVKSISSTHPFFVFVFAIVLSIFYPKIIKEEIGMSTLSLKFIAIVIMFFGMISII